LSIPDIREP